MENYGIKYLLMEGRKIWGEDRFTLNEIVVRTMKTLGDIAKLARDEPNELFADELKKELGNLIFSTIRFASDLGFDPYDCIDLAIEAQKRFAASGKAR